MDNKQVTEILNKPFWTLDEIMNLALFKWKNKNKLSSDIEAQEFIAELLDEAIDAVSCNEITVLEQKKSQKSRFEGVITPVKIYGGATFVIICVFALKYMTGNKDFMQELLRNDPNFDPLTLVIKATALLSAAVIIRFLIALFSLALFLKLYLGRNTLSGKIRYLIEYAKFSGLSVALYESGGVIDFLNSRYDLGVGEEPDTIQTGAVKSEPVEKPVDPELIAKMQQLNKLSRKSRKDLQKAITEYIELAMKAPCVCFHSQLATYISEVAKIKDGPISLQYGGGKEYTLKYRHVLALAKEVFTRVDPKRLHTKNIPLPVCSVHPYKRR